MQKYPIKLQILKKDLEHSLLWNDKDVSISWPKNFDKDLNFIISEKDQNGMTLNDLLISEKIFI